MEEGCLSCLLRELSLIQGLFLEGETPMRESKTSATIVFYLVFLICCSSLAWAGKGVYGKPTWLESTGLKGQMVELGVCDKNDTYPAYQATFIVNGPEGQRYQAVKQVVLSQDPWGFVLFPRDFRPAPQKIKPGIYSWKCIVKDRTVINFGRKFEYHPNKGFIIHQ